MVVKVYDTSYKNVAELEIENERYKNKCYIHTKIAKKLLIFKLL